jgi:chromate transporter
MHRAFVERRGWIEEREFSAMLAWARAVPGVNVVNLAVLIGNRIHGFAGAIVAVIGMLVAPSLIAVGIVQLYGRVSGATWVPALVSGTAAAAAGLLVATGLRSIGAPSQARKIRIAEPPAVNAFMIFAATFVLVGLLKFPTVPTVLGLAPISVALAYIRLDRSREAPR